MIVASGAFDERSVVSGVIVANGVFTGGGHIIEVAGRPGTPPTGTVQESKRR